MRNQIKGGVVSEDPRVCSSCGAELSAAPTTHESIEETVATMREMQGLADALGVDLAEFTGIMMRHQMAREKIKGIGDLTQMPEPKREQ